ncbi:unnamed protein product [Calicophoron daubneyi]|uniref:Uncharacterized protein n=1 Tax=Calicophoron daubneyi TaxID=300641 RepID=A0AAV2TG46_CALDB
MRRCPWVLKIVCRGLAAHALRRPQPVAPGSTKWFFNCEALAKIVSNDIIVQRDFLSEGEERNLVTELDQYLKMHRYQKSHWDRVITHFRETERKNWRAVNRPVINRLREFTFGTLDPCSLPKPVPSADQILLPLTHVLDLQEEGQIGAHVDSVRYCGEPIAVISLLSDSVARFAVAPPEEVVGLPTHLLDLLSLQIPPLGSWVDIYVPRRSLYVMRGASRYFMTHEIMSNEKVDQLNAEYHADVYKTHRVRRIAVICRSKNLSELKTLNEPQNAEPKGCTP